ncbi:TlyA family rRNA (cytidine-2'-O)-methyltransferase [Phenylobacterium hankyongense]|uniref:TlyA family rRNA (Cytidine-2'-O)-methyltransferase n=1 Tax=Phenylobacterium hankyongense TaxID=1813876 RepID=A0A328B2G0_9CAUL|nr:TlyA family RNA methyltransferase [Phenylobacterium hankyongense]RAK61383.1 TlyA family rRNA (cytidine-2'-O)-methyltransferase [Phenylobacterium hankyongense]
MSRRRADVLLVECGFFGSRAKARAAIEAGGVTADGRPVLKASDPLDEAAVVVATPAHPWVGRGALKLAHALELWPVAVKGRVVLDVGASTGGFTEVCLAKGALRVYAVDVGRGQLHPSLAADPRVASLEATDARQLTAALVPEPPGLIVTDVSFIGLAKALPAALALAAPGADLVALVKPQFEVGPDRVGKGGLVKDEAARLDALEGVKGFLEGAGWAVQATADSPIVGGDGNREFLLWARRPG